MTNLGIALTLGFAPFGYVLCLLFRVRDITAVEAVLLLASCGLSLLFLLRAISEIGVAS